MNQSLPVKLIDWERKLTQYFLAVEADGTATDIRSLEVTSQTLALAAGVEEVDAGPASDSFREALIKDPRLLTSLRNGCSSLGTSEYPGYFSYLCLTLLVETLVEDDYKTEGEFRNRLRMWLGVDLGFQQLLGVAEMWRNLSIWLRHRANAGGAFKQLVLPRIPRTWTHIGYTRRLAFPSRADIRLFERFARANEGALKDPLIIINCFAPLVSDPRCTEGLKEAFEEFRGAYLRRERALADHRFWRLVQKVRTGSSAKQPEVEIELVLNEDGEMVFIAQFDTSEEKRSFGSLGVAIKTSKAERSENLGPAIGTGIVYFRQIGTARWTSDAELTSTSTGFLVALSRTLYDKMDSSLGDFSESGGWWITKAPNSAGKIESALSPHLSSGSGARIFRASVVDGIRVASSWLGLPAFLPRLKTDTAELEARQAQQTQAAQGLSFSDDRFISEAPLVGTYIVQPLVERVGQQPPWSLRVKFTEFALPHPVLRGARYELPELRDWDFPNERYLRPAIALPRKEEVSLGSPSDDLLEALYADGQSGWEEAQLISLIRRADSLRSWDILRCLHDAGLVVPRLRRGWKGRVWTLAKPTLVKAFAGSSVLIFEGARCARSIEDFRTVVSSSGGTFFRQPGIGCWPTQLFGAEGVDGATVAERLGWGFERAPFSPGRTPGAFMSTTRMGHNYRRASGWDWEIGAFRQCDAQGDHPDLARYVHPDGKDHDLYRLQWRGSMRYFLSRTASILAAYVTVGRPMFAYREGMLFRLTREGGLPDALASALRRSTLRTAGLVGDSYAYPINQEDLSWITKLLPGVIERGEDLSHDSVASVLTKAKHSGGSLRPKWMNGRLTV